MLTLASGSSIVDDRNGYIKQNDLGTRSKKKNSKIWGFCPKFIDPHPPPLIGTKKFRSICSAFGPPPSFMKLGQNGEKSCLFVVHLEVEMQE